MTTLTTSYPAVFRRALLVLLAALPMFVLTACNDDDGPDNTDNTPTGQFDLQFVPVISQNGVYTDLRPGAQYTNAAGNTYTVTTLKFYVSDVRLVKEDGSEVAVPGVHLINLMDSTVKSAGKTAHAGRVEARITAPAGTYKGYKLKIGVPSELNNLNAATAYTDASNPLHVDNDMWWSWNPGYIFFKFEVNYDSSGTTKPAVMHIGSNGANRAAEFAWLDMTGNSQNITVSQDAVNKSSIGLDLDKVFRNLDGTGYDLNQPMKRMVHGGGNADLIFQNYCKAFFREDSL